MSAGNGSPEAAESVRLDRWLWAVRVFKTRALAQDAIRRGQVLVNGQAAKPSRNIRIGDTVHFSRLGVRDEVEVLQALSDRVGAPVAARALRRTDEGERIHGEDIERRRVERLQNRPVAPSHRPNKQDRRAIRRFKESS
ncbi:S4 domain-containing protein [uncultured Abyssibacter sp.]|uniref:RNA-binding S4 domain-containing protein n=1 Tax=uncultured Abyssibacter sp. TaxID=2320202 RepID=UPI0032B2D85D